MKRLLDDYSFSDTLRYENYWLIYSPKPEERMEIGCFLGAAVLGALLYGKDEGRERGIFLNVRDGRKEFFERYEDETLHENGGLFTTEVNALSEAYMELNGELTLLLTICGNDRLYDLAFGLMIDYMEQLVKEQVCEHIYDLVPWNQPFAQWLYDAGFVETRRQHLLAIDWTDPAIVCALADEFTDEQSPFAPDDVPSFIFEGERAEDLLNAYYQWLMNDIEQKAALYPDANVQRAAFKAKALEGELNYDFLQPEIGQLQPAHLNLFRKWMNQWTEFVKTQIEPVKPNRQRKDEEQLFFPDAVLKCPTEDMEDKYAATREYIKERKRYDEKFRKFVKNETHAKLCRQLTLLFGWYVEPNSLRKSLLRNPKRKMKQYT